MESPRIGRNNKGDRALMKANLILSKTIPKNYEHGEEIKYIDDINQEVYLYLPYRNYWGLEEKLLWDQF